MVKSNAINVLYCAGTPLSKIINKPNVQKSTFRRYKRAGNTKDCTKSGRPHSCHTKSNIRAFRERVRRDYERSIRRMARDFKMDQKSMRTILKTDLKLSSFKLKKRQHLTVFQQRKRAERASLFWNFLKSDTQSGLIVF